MRKAPYSIKNNRGGFSTIEALLAASIFAVLVTGYVGGYLYGEETTALAGARGRASALAQEGVEVVRSIRDDAFSNLIDGTSGIAITDNHWALSGGSDTADIFTRKVNIASGDAQRKNATSTVTWQQNAQRDGAISLATRLTNWSAPSFGDWTQGSPVGSLDLSGDQNGKKVQVVGNYAYLIRASGSPNFAIVNITNPAAPSLAGSLSLAGTPNDIAVSGNYAYIANAHNTQELQIIDISVPATPVVVGTFDAAGGADALGVAVSGTTVFLVRAEGVSDEFVAVNVATPAASALIGSLGLAGDVNEVTVLGGYAYVATTDDTNELQVVNISNLASPTLASTLGFSGNNDAKTISGFSTILLVGQGSTLRVVDSANPLTPTLQGALIVSGTINDIVISPNNAYAFLGTSASSAELQIVNLTTLASPMLLGSVNVAGSSAVKGVSYDAVRDHIVAGSALDTGELLIFAPQ